METRLIKYIGHKPKKTDTVLKTSRVWEGHGAVVEVPAGEAASYLAFPAVWCQTTAKEMKAEENAAATALEMVEKVCAMAQDLPLEALKECSSRIQFAIRTKQADHDKAVAEAAAKVAIEQQDAAAVEARTGEPQITLDPESEYAKRRLAEIEKALVELDRNNPEHFGKTGEPLAAAVQPFLTFKPTSGELASFASTPAVAASKPVEAPGPKPTETAAQAKPSKTAKVAKAA